MKDITPDLLERIKKDFERQISSNSKISDLIGKLDKGTATYLDANEYSIEIGRTLANVLGKNISSDVLPNGKMYYNIATRIINDTLSRNHDIIADYAAKTQKALNTKAKIGLKVVKPALNQDRIDGIVNRASSEDRFDNVKWILDEPIVNFSQSIVDDSIRENADIHYQKGLTPRIIRKESGKCCKWCRSIAGIYAYPDVPKDVYRRHQNCRCTVDYYPGDGKVQNVHSKTWKDVKKIEVRKKLGNDKYESYVSIKKEWLKHSGKGKVLNLNYWEFNDEKYYVDGKHVTLAYTKKEKEVAEWVSKMFGKDVSMVPRVNYPLGVSTPDYIIDGKKFDLKEIQGSGKNVIDGNMKKSKKQANNFILDFSKSTLSDEDIYNQLQKIYESRRRETNIVIIKRLEKVIDIIEKRK